MQLDAVGDLCVAQLDDVLFHGKLFGLQLLPPQQIPFHHLILQMASFTALVQSASASC